MGQVAVTINGRSYQIACEDGQDAHISELGAYIDKRVKDLAESVGQIGDTRLLVMACLLVSDELSELYDEIDSLRSRLRQAEAAGPETARPEAARAPASAGKAAADGAGEETLARGLDAVAERIETIAARLERA